MKSNFEDIRGTITDLLVTPEYSVTLVTFNTESVRGNHRHDYTHQYDFVVEGKLLCAFGKKKKVVREGKMVTLPPGLPHAYKAKEYSEIISIHIGKRRGENYEEDTIRLNIPLL